MSSGDPLRPRHLYLHVPFCRERCPYCDYPTLVSPVAHPGPWLQAVGDEAALRRASGVVVDEVRTVLVGGGTPSLLGAALSGLAAGVLANAPRVEEWTVEANPEDISEEVVQAWADAGVTRVSLGVQSLRPEALRWLGRAHDPDAALRAMDVLSRAPLATWSVDLIFGLPTAVDPDPVEAVERTLLGGAVPHVSLFELTLDDPAGPDRGRMGRSGFPEPGERPEADELADQFLRFHDTLPSLGYEAYQITAFARPGHASAHADGILESGSWLGLGPGAHSRLGGLHTWNLLDWRGYTSAIGEGELPVERAERPDPATRDEDRIRAALARSAGIPAHGLLDEEVALVDRWVRDGHARRDPSGMRLTPSGWLLLDGLARALAAVRRAP